MKMMMESALVCFHETTGTLLMYGNVGFFVPFLYRRAVCCTTALRSALFLNRTPI